MNDPLVSIIMPAYNSSSTIEASIRSVINQSYQSWELIVTDDCSNDTTVKIVHDLTLQDKRIQYEVLDVNSGAGVARNNSIEKSKGQYIAFLDADDLWHPEKLTKQINYMTTEGISFSYTKYQKMREGELLGIVSPPLSITYNELIYSNVIGCLTAVYNRELLGKRFMPRIRKRQDMGLWLDILADIESARCLPEVLAFYRVDTGMTANKLSVLKYQWEFYRSVLGFGVFKSIAIFFVYGYRGLIKFFV